MLVLRRGGDDFLFWVLKYDEKVTRGTGAGKECSTWWEQLKRRHGGLEKFTFRDAGFPVQP